MSSRVRPDLILGNAGWNGLALDEIRQQVEILSKHGINTIDSAVVHAGAETAIGELGLAKSFTINSKPRPFPRGAINYDGVVQSAAESLERMKTECVSSTYPSPPSSHKPQLTPRR